MTTKPSNPFEYGKDPELNRIFDNLIALRDKVATQFAKAEKIAGLGSVTNFHPLKDVKIDMPNYRYERTRDSYRKTPLATIEAMVRPAVERARQAIADAEVENAPFEEQNKQLVQQVTELMTRIGIPSTYTTYDYPSTRSRTKKSVSHTAGYVADLERTRPKSNLSSAKYTLDNYVRDFESWLKAEKDAEMKEKIAKDEAAVQKNILGNPTLVATLMQAGVNILEEVQKAVPGQKCEVISYCKAQAISNIKANPNPDFELIEKIQDL
jgi:phenylpyruvate tautomerase PptA (4-oxalocrotonate tautomerase family)